MSLEQTQQRHDKINENTGAPEHKEGGLFSQAMNGFTDAASYGILNGWNRTVHAPDAHKSESDQSKEVSNAADIWTTLKATQKNGSMMGQADVATSDREKAMDGAQYNTDGLYVSASAAAKADKWFDERVKAA